MKQLHKICQVRKMGFKTRFMCGLVAGSSLSTIGAMITTLEPMADNWAEGT